MKKTLSILLVLIMVLGCMTAACAEAEGSDDVSAQIDLIHSKLDEMLQKEESIPWYYSVMDFNHNGKLEFFAASQHPDDRSTNLRVWEVNADNSGLSECTLQKDPDESFPDIISTAADTFYDAESDTWSCLFYDNIILSPSEVYTVMCSVSLKDGTIGYQEYAVERSELFNSLRYVTHMDADGNSISADEFNSIGVKAFSGADRSSTNFDWFRADEARDAARLADSYAVFTGEKAAPEQSPVAEPPILAHDELQPVSGQAGETNAVYMVITKNPTSEKKKAGSSIKFVADANVYDSAYWTFITADGTEVDLDYFQAHFVSSVVDGAYGPVLSIRNLDEYMDGWGAYCTFSFDGQTAVTSTAWIKIKR